MAFYRYAIGALCLACISEVAAISGSGTTTEEPPLEPEGPPKMVTNDGSLFTSVPTGRDIHFSIGRDFELSVGSIPGHIEDAMISSMAYTDMVATAASSAAHTSTTAALSEAVSSLDSSISASESGLVESLDSTRTSLSNAINAAQQSVAGAFIASQQSTISTFNALNSSVLANAAENAARNACLAADLGNVYFNGFCHRESKFQMLKHNMREHYPGPGNNQVDQRNGVHVGKTKSSMILWSYSDTFGYQSSETHTTAVGYSMIFTDPVNQISESQSCLSHSSGFIGQWRIWPTTLDYWTSSSSKTYKARSTELRLETNRYGGASTQMQGWPNRAENAIVATEIDGNMMTIRKNMRDRRLSDAAYALVEDRQVTYTSRTGAGAAFEVTYTDTHGSHGPSGQQMCSTALYVNGVLLPGSEYSSHNPSYSGRWRINPSQFKWIVPTVTSGVGCRAGQACRMDVRCKRLAASQCLYGWGAQSMNSLSVVELPAHTFATGGLTKFAVAPTQRSYMPDIRNTAAAWTTITRRVVSNFPVTSDTSVVEVMYADTIGVNMISHTWGCGHRVYYTYPGGDGVCGKEQWSHSGSVNGWRIFSQTLKFYCELPAGRSYNFFVQTYKNSGARECLNGWLGTPGVMKVTERL